MPKGTYQQLLALPASAAALDPFVVDSFSDFSGFSPNSTTGVATITTTRANCVLIGYAGINSSTGSLTFSSVTGGGLTWTFRKRVQFTGAGFSNTMEEWWAIAPSILSAVTFTATASASASFVVLNVFAVSGADTATPFDANAAVPASASGAAAVAPTVNVSTSNANDMLIGFISCPGGGGTSAGAGFTQIGFANASSIVEQKTVTATQTNTAVLSGTSPTTPWGDLADAIRKHP